MRGEWREDVVLAAYVAYLGSFRKWGGVKTVLEGLKTWFRLVGAVYPGESEVVARAFGGVKKRQKGRVNKKEPVRVWMLKRVSEGVNSRIGVRNLALLLVGFFALLRVSELVQVKWSDVYWSGEGVLVRVRRAKGADKAEWWPLVVREEVEVCPVRCLRVWWRLCGRPKGNGFVFPGRGKGRHLSEGQVRKVVKGELEKVGVRGDRFSSHSLRRGGAQLLDMRQAPLSELQGMGGWRSEKSPYEYLGTRIGAKFRAAKRMAGRYNLCFLFCVRGGVGACLGAECADGSGRTVEQQRVDVVCRHSRRDHCIINCLAQFMCPVNVSFRAFLP